MQLCLHDVDVIHNSRVVSRTGTVELGQDVCGLLVVASQQKPPGRLRQESRTNHHDKCKDNLEGNRESPLDGRVDVGEAKVKPIRNKSADSNDGTFKAHEETTVVCLGALGLPYRNSRSVHSVANARDDTADDKLSQAPLRTDSGSRNGGANNDEETATEEESCAADLFTPDKREEGSAETSKLVARGNGAAHHGNMSRVCFSRTFGDIGGRKLLCELFTGNDARHQPLVISK